MEKYYVNPIGRIRVRGEEMWIQLDQKLTAALKALDGFS
ncbi:MAG: tRNA (N6-threonylcarbamoyladenosine(37)-N6)-methyltransferase TrmO, partial [Clostridium sp.]|nr:tRNA (N6-threonylcarbamoyladenosine(37)-N6)-methyltransferase TrmO [Clostridium sp.]